MPHGYALAHLYDPNAHPEVLDYIERIQSTLDPFSGRFIVHGPRIDVIEGEWPGTVVIIEFPSIGDARAWYASTAYQEILHLRTDHIHGEAIIFEGVDSGYDASKTAAALRDAVAATADAAAG